MTTAFFTHPDCLGHVTQPGHPEKVERLVELLKGFKGEAFQSLDRFDAKLGEVEAIERVHPRSYIDHVRTTAAGAGDKQVKLDPDTPVVSGSWAAALRGVGALTEAVDQVCAGEATNAFCAIRPPGHHAETAKAMGFCLFNNVAIAARHAMEKHGLTRIAIVDFDVHHGNGTQEIFERDQRVFFASSHQFPHYPGTGSADETGIGNILNCPLPANSSPNLFRKIWETEVLPRVEAFDPELILISAGFDAHKADPLSDLNLTEDDFVWITERLTDLAGRLCSNRIVSTLEGGYDLEALQKSAVAHVQALMRANSEV